MCDVEALSVENPNGGADITVTCKISGKPVNISNEYGMYCEDMCGLKEDKVAKLFLDGFLKVFEKVFD